MRPATADEPDADELLRAFREGGVAVGPDDAPETAALLADVVRGARAAWPDVEVDPARFARHAGRHVAGLALPDALVALRAGDLLLAFACAEGSPRALAVFDEISGVDLRAAASRARLDPEDFAQAVRAKLFAPPGKIADFAGQGDLRSWLRVITLRTAIDLSRKKSGSEPAIPDSAAQALVAPDDTESEYLRRLYGAAFKQAFEDAARGLLAEQRNLLRQHYVHGLGVDALASLHRVHRATAARWVARAREDLLAETRRILGERLGVTRGELESVMRLVRSDVALSVSRVFA